MPESNHTLALYIDTNPFIYAIEGNDTLAAPVRELLEWLQQKPGTGTTSELTLAEVLPNARLPLHQRQYLDLLMWSGIIELQPISRSILLETARYRRFLARRRSGRSMRMVKLPDAIHVVTAIQNKCTLFLSADKGVKLPSHIRRVEPDRAGITSIIRKLA